MTQSKPLRPTIITAAIGAALILTASALGGMLMPRPVDVTKPAASEFGPGPRSSAKTGSSPGHFSGRTAAAPELLRAP
jgi:hypothetical protein